jgi:hypothetical protein
MKYVVLTAVSAVWSRRTGYVLSGRILSWSRTVGGGGVGVAGTYVTRVRVLGRYH